MVPLQAGFRGIHLLGVFDSKEGMDRQIRDVLFYPGSRYVLIEVCSGRRNNAGDLLEKLGVKGTGAGALYLYDAVLLGLQNPDYMRYVTKSIYSDVALLRRISRSTVESSIRRAISASWENADPLYRRMVFGLFGSPGRKRPSNCTYIRMLVRYLRGEEGPDFDQGNTL